MKNKAKEADEEDKNPQLRNDHDRKKEICPKGKIEGHDITEKYTYYHST